MSAIFTIKGLILASSKEQITLLIGAKEQNIHSRNHITKNDMLNCRWVKGIHSLNTHRTGEEVIARGRISKEQNNVFLDLISIK